MITPQYSLCIREGLFNGRLNLLTETGWKWYGNEHSTPNTKWQTSICKNTSKCVVKLLTMKNKEGFGWVTNDSGCLPCWIDTVGSLESTICCEEGGEVPGIGTEWGNSYTFCLEVLKCPSNIQDWLNSGTHHGHWGPAQFSQVGTHIKSWEYGSIEIDINMIVCIRVGILRLVCVCECVCVCVIKGLQVLEVMYTQARKKCFFLSTHGLGMRLVNMLCVCVSPSLYMSLRWQKVKGIHFLLFSPSLCTPPIPPVMNTGMPALWAHSIVADTVVPPLKPWGGGGGIKQTNT